MRDAHKLTHVYTRLGLFRRGVPHLAPAMVGRPWLRTVNRPRRRQPKKKAARNLPLPGPGKTTAQSFPRINAVFYKQKRLR